MEDGRIMQLLEDYRSYIKRILRLSILIDNYSVNTFGEYRMSTMGQLNKIQELFEKQRVYIRRIRYVKDIIKKLHENERKCLVHYYIKGRKTQDIDKHFSFSERTFYRHKKNAVENFLQIVKNDEYGFENAMLN